MSELSSSGRQALDDIAQRTGFSREAVKSMMAAVQRGKGGMAQFDHPEFGGRGQWMRGGMTMLSDMFNHHLKGRVHGLCTELSQLLACQPELVCKDEGHKDWWPTQLGQPNSAGSQDGVRYAYFAQARRLAIDAGGRVTVYDTLDHRIGGVSQQQSGDASVSFTSQHGLVDVASLPVVSGDGSQRSTPVAYNAPASSGGGAASVASSGDIVATIEKLAALQSKGILSAEEFAAKKAELLGRL